MELMTKLLSDQGLAICLVVAGLLGVAWLGKRLAGSDGLLEKWWASLFGEKGIARAVGSRWIDLADHLQGATSTMLETQAKVVELQTRHDARAAEATARVADIHQCTQEIREAALYACLIIDELEARLPADQRSEKIPEYVRRIREILLSRKDVPA